MSVEMPHHDDQAQPPPKPLTKRHQDPISGAAMKLPEHCQVCGTASNVRKNFGVPSCVSCRIFYSRNTGKQLICYQNGSCRIEGPSRKSCAACRFQKCTRAGMQKSRERKYKFRKCSLDAAPQDAVKKRRIDNQQQQRKSPLKSLKSEQAAPVPLLPDADLAAAAAAAASGFPPLDLVEAVGGLETSVMDKNLFVHFYKLADMFRVSFDCPRDCLIVRDTFSGLNLLEVVTKRSLAIIRFLPHFAKLDRNLVSAMVSEKISGLITILRTLHYRPDTSVMAVRWAPNTPGPAAAGPAGGSLDDSRSSSSSTSGESETIQQPLLHIVNGLFADLTKGDNPLMTEAEVVTVYLAALRLYTQCHELFRDRLNIGVTLLLGMYFFLPDYKTVRINEDQMRDHQCLYLRCLQDLLKVLSRDPSEAMDMYNRVLFLLTEVKSVDFYLSLLSRHVRFRSG